MWGQILWEECRARSLTTNTKNHDDDDCDDNEDDNDFNYKMYFDIVYTQTMTENNRIDKYIKCSRCKCKYINDN